MSPADENQVISALCADLESRGWEIEQRLHTTQQGVDVIAIDPARTRHYIEAKGATSSRLTSRRYGQPYGSAEVRINVTEAFYTAAVVAGRAEPNVVPGVAFQDDALHRRYVEPLEPACAALGIQIYWVAEQSR